MAVFEFITRISYDDIHEDLSLSLRGAMSMMQEAAIVHSDQLGYSITNVDKTGVIWMLVQWRVRILQKAFWNETVTVRTWPRTMERAKSERDFEICSKDGEIIAVGESVWVLVSTQTGRITRITSQIASAYDLTEKRAFTDLLPQPSGEIGLDMYICRVLKRDIDTNHHVNNRVYLDFAGEAIPDEIDVASFKEIYVHYRKQLLLGDEVHCRYRCENEAHIVDVCQSENGQPCCTVVYR